MDAAPRIRTPDQRIRVFVSSTLRELEPERRAVRDAVERMRLAPVMFELGARPHPPRALYRSYLAQSDVFVGIYGEKYGWVAPDEHVSGLEDEYRLSAGKPLLIYIKEPAPDREERLSTLLADIRADDRASYKSFRTPEELGDLVLADLATLLAERFDAAGGETTDAGGRAGRADSRARTAGIPAPYTELIGRDHERATVAALLARPDVRIVTLTGPGGVGKSRLAIEIAVEAARAGREVAFAPLEALPSPERVTAVLARALGVRDTGEGVLADKVAEAVADRDVLLVVDNMEHLLAAADVLVRLVTDAPRLQLLVTSRSPLRVRAERVVEVAPLDVPDAGSDADAASAASAVALFVARASAVNPAFRLTRDNVGAVTGICRALDGMPLAIELAAARMRVLSPAQVLARLDSALDLLVGGPRDLPERQRAQSRTIAWSVDLLSPHARRSLAVLSVFQGTFRLDAADSVLTAMGAPDVLACVEELVDASLLARTALTGEEAFRMLGLVRAYADGLLDDDARAQATVAWTTHYAARAREVSTALLGTEQLEVLRSLELEVENLGSVLRSLIERRELDAAAEYAWSLYLFLWAGGYLGVVEHWMAVLQDVAEREGRELLPRSRAIALYYRNAIRFWQVPGFDPLVGLREARDLFAGCGDTAGAALTGVSLGLGMVARPDGADIAGAESELESSLDGFRRADSAWGQAMTLVVLGRVEMMTGRLDQSTTRFEESLQLATAQGGLLAITIARNHRGWARFMAGDLAGAREDFTLSLERSLALGHEEGIAYGLEGFVGIAAREGDARRAGLLLGAARTLRVRSGIFNAEAFEYYMIPLSALRENGAATDLDAAIEEGRSLTVAEALEHVRG